MKKMMTDPSMQPFTPRRQSRLRAWVMPAMVLACFVSSAWMVVTSRQAPHVTSYAERRQLEHAWWARLHGHSPMTQGTFRTTNLIVDDLLNNSTETFITLGNVTSNDLDLWSGGPHTSRVEIDLSSTQTTIAGIEAGEEGDLLFLWNGGNGGLGNPIFVTLLNNASTSSPVNRIWVASGKTLNIANNDGVLLIYDGGFGWTVFGGATSTIRAMEFSYEPVTTPTALASGSTTNDYNPWVGTRTTSYVRQDITGSGTATLTGLVAAGAPNSDGRVVVIQNVSGSGTLAFSCKTTSNPDNQFACPADTAYSLSPSEAVSLIYNTTSNFWYVLSFGKAHLP